jgi:RimJ/RimL family protein N-acetyltransferase
MLLIALTQPQLRAYLNPLKEVEKKIEIPLSQELMTEQTKRAMRLKIEKMNGVPCKDHPWYTYWLLVLNTSKRGVGVIGFKGIHTASVEIGYAIEPGHRNMGYMTEAVKALVMWAFKDERCHSIFAPVPRSNPASSKVLQKVGFWLEKEDNEILHWKVERN